MIRLLFFILGKIFFKSHTHKEKVNCDCGQTFYVYHNLYGTCSGGGSCNCGARIIIN